jgi:hypothetical protein
MGSRLPRDIDRQAHELSGADVLHRQSTSLKKYRSAVFRLRNCGLATLVPPRRHHLVRYHGVFAPNASWRGSIVPRPMETEGEARWCWRASRRARASRVENSGQAAPSFPTALG